MTNKIQLRRIVDRILPLENFFTFKISKQFNNSQNEIEKNEMKRIINSVTTHGSYEIDNIGDAYLEPIRIPNDQRDEITSNL